MTLTEPLRRILRTSGRGVATLAIVAVALIVGRGLWVYYQEAPWTRDGRVAADVVTIAPDVSGLVSDVLVHDNQTVRKGDVLFRIDPDRFQLALQQAQAVAASRKAEFDEAVREAARTERLNDLSVSRESQEQRVARAEEDAASYRQALADQAVAELNLQRSSVRSPVDGTVTNVDLEPGDYVVTGKGVMALVDSATLRVEGYFEETKLPRIHPGDRVSIRLLGESRLLSGRVESISAGIADRERTDSPDLLANINPTFTWVRLAQRVPVRVKLDPLPEGVRLVVGRTATVSVESGTASGG
jgi:multidrug resistance efflux pump